MSTTPSNDPSPRFLPAGAVNDAVVSPAEVEDLLSDITEYDPAANMRLAELEQFDSNSITPELARKRDARRQAGLDGYYDLPPGSGLRSGNCIRHVGDGRDCFRASWAGSNRSARHH